MKPSTSLDKFKLHILKKVLLSIFCLILFSFLIATIPIKSSASPNSYYNKSFVLPAGTFIHTDGKKMKFNSNVSMTVRGHQMINGRPFYTVQQVGSQKAYAIDSNLLRNIPGFENCNTTNSATTRTARQVIEVTNQTKEKKPNRLSNRSNSSATFVSPIQSSGCRISSNAGYRNDPKGKGRRHHDGCDFAAGRGTPVLAASNGLVINTVTGRKSGGEGYGNQSYILHFPPGQERLRASLQKTFQKMSYTDIRKYLLQNPIQTKLPNGKVLKNIISVSSHLQKVTKAKGSIVQKGEMVAAVNRTGRSTGDHLHYEIFAQGCKNEQNEAKCDPRDLIDLPPKNSGRCH